MRSLSATQTSQNTRDLGIELYRIIVMLLIIAHHYVVNLSIDGVIYANPTSFNSLALLLLGAWGKPGINCFVLITGYFMCQSKITVRKFIKLLFEVWIYKILFSCIFWITGYEPFTLKGLIKVIIPITSIAQNFPGTYILFFLCIPFINILIKNLNEKQHVLLTLLLALIYIVFGTVPIFTVDMNYISWYFVLYMLASYVRLYPKQIFINKRFWGIASLISISTTCVTIIVCAWLTTKLDMNLCYYAVKDCNTVFSVAIGLTSFLYFKNLNINIKYAYINTVASTTFGILMIHANSDAMRKFLWQDVFNNVQMYDSGLVFLYAPMCVIVVFAVCCGLDLLRIKFIEKPFLLLWDKHYNKIYDKYKAIERKICFKLDIN